jgi:hypothetical protein
MAKALTDSTEVYYSALALTSGRLVLVNKRGLGYEPCSNASQPGTLFRGSRPPYLHVRKAPDYLNELRLGQPGGLYLSRRYSVR